MATVKLHDITKHYETGEIITKVLKGISLEINEGEFVSIMGPSGSGKSTLMHILGFLDRLSTGSYLFEDHNISEFDDNDLAEIRNLKIGFVFQAYNLLPRTTALDNVTLPLVYAGVPQSKQKKLGLEVLDKVALSDRVMHKPNELSGGQQQRVAIARALINKPRIIFADEPTGNLDTKSSLEIMKILQDLNKEGNTIVLVTHEDDIARMTKRTLILRDGLIEKDIAVDQQIIK